MPRLTPFGSPRPHHAEASTDIANSIPPHLPATGPLRQILIVEDDPILCAAIGRQLSENSFSVSLACTTNLADTLLRRSAFDLVIAQLPTQSVDPIGWIRRLSATTPAPLIVITNHRTDEIALAATPAAFAGIFLKPLDVTALTALATGLLLTDAI